MVTEVAVGIAVHQPAGGGGSQPVQPVGSNGLWDAVAAGTQPVEWCNVHSRCLGEGGIGRRSEIGVEEPSLYAGSGVVGIEARIGVGCSLRWLCGSVQVCGQEGAHNRADVE